MPDISMSIRQPTESQRHVDVSPPEGGWPSSRELLQTLYEVMMESRLFDLECTRLLEEGVAVPHYHSGVGQEALMVGSAAPLRTDDTYIYTHRGYGHLLAKGVSVEELSLDMWLKSGGTNHGRGAVMHVNRPDLGLPGREGVFGSRFGIAVGIALANRLKGSDAVVVCAYGEAVGSRGPLYEAMNMAVLWDLPVLFLAENNGWSFSTPTEWVFPRGLMSPVWRGFDIPVRVVDGNDIEAVYWTISDMIDHMRGSPTPAVIEGLTYRMDPHIWFDDAEYQSDEETEAWRVADPLVRAERSLRKFGVGDDAIDAVTQNTTSRVRRAVADALSAPDVVAHSPVKGDPCG